MLGLPKSTEMSKQLPKKAVYAKFQMNTAAKEKIDADISRIATFIATKAKRRKSLKDGFRFKSRARKTMISAKKKYPFLYQLPISTITFTTAVQFSLLSILGITD